VLARYEDIIEACVSQELVRWTGDLKALLADWLGIDLRRIDAEKRAMLDAHCASQ